MAIMLLQGCAGSQTAPTVPEQNPVAPIAATHPVAKATPVTPTSRQASMATAATRSNLPPEPPLLLALPATSANAAASGPASASPQVIAATTIPAALPATAPSTAKPPPPLVLLYAPAATQAYFAKRAIDAKPHAQAWESFLRKYRIPFETALSVELLESTQAAVLLLPSAVVMTDREMKAVENFRANGGAVLATWQTATRDEKGEWRGYAFMESALDVKVAGSTEADEEESFVMPYGDNTVAHSLPAGLRIWTERVKDWYPLRMSGQNPAAQVMDWSRKVTPGKPGAAIVFGERTSAAGKHSRAVVFGFPERLWISADPKALDALAHNALTWLLRIPDAYLPAWPHPFGSAFVLAVDLADTPADTDPNIGKLVGDLGGKASYYVLTEQATPSAPILKKIQSLGHELGYLGDRFDGFKNQSSAKQGKRIDTMLAEMKSAAVDVAAAGAGFHAPMEAYDKTTEKILQERGFGHFIVGPDASDARLPFFASASTAAAKGAGAMLLLPRTQNGPEDLLGEGDPVVGMNAFLGELDLADKMGGLSVVRILGQTVVTDPQMAEIAARLKALRERMWLATAGQVTEWWRARDAISASVDTNTAPPLLTVRIKGDKPLPRPAAVWVNLPEPDSALRLAADGAIKELPKTSKVDPWRDAIVLDGLAPGEYRWRLYFDRVPKRGTP